MPLRIVVREASEHDIPAIANLIARLKLLNEELDPHYKVVENLEAVTSEYVQKCLAREDCRVIVAEDEESGEIAGVLVYELVDRVFYIPKLKARITEFYILPRYRRKRLGTLLLEKAEEFARKDGAGMLTVVYPAGNVLADVFYKNKGFIDLAYEKYKSLK